MCFFLGWAIGASFLPNMGDRHGKRIILLKSNIVLIIAMITALVLPGNNIENFFIYMALFCLLGMARLIQTSMGFVLIFEYSE